MKRVLASCLFLMVMVVNANAQNLNQLTITSDSLDYVGQGQVYNYGEQDIFKLTQYEDSDVLRIDVSDPFTTTWWNFTLIPPTGQYFTTGITYETREFNYPSYACLNVSGNGRACSPSVGSMTIDTIVYNDQQITYLELHFENHGLGRTAACYGTLKIRTDQPVPTRIGTWGALKAAYR